MALSDWSFANLTGGGFGRILTANQTGTGSAP